MAWVTADRARAAAQASNCPASIAEAARMSAIPMRRHGHHDAAAGLLTGTAIGLGAESADVAPEVLAIYGSLLCTAAYTVAQHAGRAQAQELIAEAEASANRLVGLRASSAAFSPTSVTIYQIGVHTALGDAGTALDHARRIDVRRIPTPNGKPGSAWTPHGPGSVSATRARPSSACKPLAAMPLRSSAGRRCAV